MRLASAAAVVVSCAVAFAADAPEGLELELVLTTKGPVQPGERIEFETRLANRTKHLTHNVVRPNEGSQLGWREPHVFWTATFVGKDGAERALEAALPSGDGGLFVPEWWKDVTPLAPGSSIAVGFMTPPGQVFDIQEDGKLRLVAHYKWNAGKETRGDPLSGGASAPTNLGGMKDVAPYDVASKPAEIEVRRQFEIVATAKGAFKPGIQARLSDLVDVQVRSLSTSPLHFDPAEWQISLRDDDKVGESPEVDLVAPKKGGEAFDLAPGAATPLLREGPLAQSRDVRVRFPSAGKARIAVVLQRVSGPGPVLRSNWIDVKVER